MDLDKFFLLWVLIMTLISGAGLCFLSDVKSKVILSITSTGINTAALYLRSKSQQK